MVLYVLRDVVEQRLRPESLGGTLQRVRADGDGWGEGREECLQKMIGTIERGAREGGGRRGLEEGGKEGGVSRREEGR